MRDGVEADIDAEELVPGDLIVYEAGNSISADAQAGRGPRDVPSTTPL